MIELLVDVSLKTFHDSNRPCLLISTSHVFSRLLCQHSLHLLPLTMLLSSNCALSKNCHPNQYQSIVLPQSIVRKKPTSFFNLANVIFVLAIKAKDLILRDSAKFIKIMPQNQWLRREYFWTSIKTNTSSRMMSRFSLKNP